MPTDEIAIWLDVFLFHRSAPPDHERAPEVERIVSQLFATDDLVLSFSVALSLRGHYAQSAAHWTDLFKL